ncbi:hypothetical protein BGZ76_007051 [Entomortierella beljakovae]|nr:hypothetical protein BGZ76_007051 [Entomortierella beljakovae]
MSQYHDVTTRWTFQDSQYKYMRTKPIGKWSQDGFLDYLKNESKQPELISQVEVNKLWVDELARVKALGTLLPTEVRQTVENLIDSDLPENVEKIAQKETKEGILWDIALDNAEIIQPFELQNQNIKEIMAKDSKPYEGFYILDMERLPSKIFKETKRSIFSRFNSRSNPLELSTPERTFIQALVFMSADALGEYLGRTYIQMTRANEKTAETIFLWNMTNTVLILWEKNLLVDEVARGKNERWWLKRLHGSLTESLDSITDFVYVEAEIESSSVKEYWGPNPPKFDGVGTAATVLGDIDILITEAKPYGGVGASGEESDRRKIQEALICLFLSLEAKLPKEHQRHIVHVPMVAILLSGMSLTKLYIDST